ncbi:cytochrome b-245 heavy chain-like [Sycon ciliatum]|uniref:cytochrome b-245 heavy chain-like n=1 Tax=Sycon ciliatum TaxID=27933 RepID=UPI0031F6F39D
MVSKWLVNEGPRWAFTAIWIGLNIFLFAWFCHFFETADDFWYLRRYIGVGLCLARGAAVPINLNCTLILLPVCRNLISLVRGSGIGVWRWMRRLLDKNLTFHKTLAWAILFWSAIHTGAHFWNYHRVVTVWEENPGMTCIPPMSNPVRGPGNDPIIIMWATVAGFTGFIILAVFFLMITSSIEVIRRSYFEVFWYTHHLFLIFFAAFLAHGFGELIVGQNNTDEHNPEFCYSRNRRFANGTCETVIIDGSGDRNQCDLNTATFSHAGAQSWKWVVGPLALYFLERVIRIWRSWHPATICRVVQHPSKVLEIQMQKEGFYADVGQYVFIQAPEIAPLEWHPFTLSSSPEEDCFSVHIRIVGDWTENLARRCGMNVSGKAEDEPPPISAPPKLLIDGPFGTASEDVFKHRVAVCIGAGIGVTPFASVLKSIWYQSLEAGSLISVQKVYFFWLCSDLSAFEWFADLMRSLEDQMNAQQRGDFVQFRIYLTRPGNTAEQIRALVASTMAEDGSPIVQMQDANVLQFARPNWVQIFDSIGSNHLGEDIGVFFCGPKALSSRLHTICNQFTNTATGTRFFYNKENF